jgi:hypothetical protein
VQHLCFRRLAARRGLLLAAGLALVSVDAVAQQTADPLAPFLAPSPTRATRFQQAQVTSPQFAPQIGFTPPPAASGAGDTGYDSTNARKQTKAKAKPNNKPSTKPNAAAAPPPKPSLPVCRRRPPFRAISNRRHR